jgi:hypothetical protein
MGGGVCRPARIRGREITDGANKGGDAERGRGVERGGREEEEGANGELWGMAHVGAHGPGQ